MRDVRNSVILRRFLSVGLPILIFVLVVAVSLWRVTAAEDDRYRALRYTFVSPACEMSAKDCRVKLTVSNPTSDMLIPRYIDTGGGPLAGAVRHVWVYDEHGVRCAGNIYAPDDPSYADFTLRPGSSQAAVLSCEDSRPANMGRPAKVVIYGATYHP